jgi:lipopolysaccharide export system permease protein
MESRRSMSRILLWYIIRETLFSFLILFLFFVFIFVLNQLLIMAQDILSKRVPVLQVMLLLLYALPGIIALAAPFAALVGTLVTIGRLNSDNEILVMLSSGLTYFNVFFPAILVGVLITMISFFANDVLLPAGTIQFSRLYRRILVSTPALELEANSVKRFKDTVVITGNVEGSTIDDVLILDKTSDGERRLIMARKAELKDTGQTGLSLDLDNAFIQSSKEIARRDYDYASSSFLRYWVPQDDFIQEYSSISPREMSSTDVRREIKVKEKALEERLDARYNKTMEYGLLLESALRRGPGYDLWNRRANGMTNFTREVETAGVIKKDRTLLIYRLEYNKKFSMPFGALSFIFLSVSLGLVLKKNGQTIGLVVGFLISVLYWALLLGGQTMGTKLGYSPFWTMWLPNVLAISIGTVLCVVRVRV